ncbi:uncharacterized protein UV8b_03176 [Ustilaginoidea virens]|uniref:Uncharacterized protein n=1 Tax=Ustilaginoidea virens TaxID=1159556 RepID=A0A8E5HNW2_USTVR|nr:uncharacterized protein UV8b_03176 [Ustilaginoidea virens]QUC18935.1 hypothetical protein UV8b_03176 [Ustilaginoidea virens]
MVLRSRKGTDHGRAKEPTLARCLDWQAQPLLESTLEPVLRRPRAIIVTSTPASHYYYYHLRRYLAGDSKVRNRSGRVWYNLFLQIPPAPAEAPPVGFIRQPINSSYQVLNQYGIGATVFTHSTAHRRSEPDAYTYSQTVKLKTWAAPRISAVTHLRPRTPSVRPPSLFFQSPLSLEGTASVYSIESGSFYLTSLWTILSACPAQQPLAFLQDPWSISH